MLRALILLAGISAGLSGCTQVLPKTLPCGHPARADTGAAPLPERSSALLHEGDESRPGGSIDSEEPQPAQGSSSHGHHDHHGHGGMR